MSQKSQKSASSNNKSTNNTSSVKADDRFAHIAYDPKFKSLPKKKSKVRIESRFKSMFDDDRFNPKFMVDKRGRKLNPDQKKEDLSRFYHLASDDEDEDEENEKDSDVDEKESKKVSKKESKKQQNVKKPSFKNIAANIRGDMGISSSEDSDSDDDNDDNDNVQKKKKKAKQQQQQQSKKKQPSKVDEESDEEEENDEDDDEEEEEDIEKGEEEEEEEEESSENDEPFDNVVTEANEEDVWMIEEQNSVPLGETVTHRLAVCNLDWDHLRAVDLLVLFNSFKPAGGVIKSVTVYPSRFGVKRMAIEDKAGPFAALAKDLEKDKNDNSNNDDNSDNSDDDENENENEDVKDSKPVLSSSNNKEDTNKLLRKYQLSRLRYYYAIVDCDTPETANGIYEQCDGLEIESTSNLIDLRFVPDEETFDEFPPRDQATDVPHSGFRAPEFYSSALQSSKVKLSWDEDDDQRVALTRRKFNKAEFQENDVRAYLASGSSSEGEDGDDNDDSDDSDDSDDNGNGSGSDEELSDTDDGGARENKKSKKKSKSAIVDKYRELLVGFKSGKSFNPSSKNHAKYSDGDDDESGDKEMTITFEPGLKAAAEEALKRKEKREKLAGLTVWEQHLENKREKKRERRKLAKKGGKGIDSDDNLISADDDDDDDDDTDGIDMSDPFFRDEIMAINKSNKKAAAAAAAAGNNNNNNNNKSGQVKKKSKEELAQEAAAKAKEKAELELLMIDEQNSQLHGQHFSLKKILETEKGKKHKKKKGKKGKKGSNGGDDDDDDDDDDDNNNSPLSKEQDNFKINVKDPRFQAMFEHPEYSIDPTNPRFKKTKAMATILDERMRRRMDIEAEKDSKSSNVFKAPSTSNDNNSQSNNTNNNTNINNNKNGPKKMDPSLSLLVNSVKRKAQDRLQSETKKPRL